MKRSGENVIEWLTGQDTMSVTFNQQKWINRAKWLAKNYPEYAQIIAENKDGSIFAHISLKALHLTVYRAKNTDVDGDAEESEE